MIKRIEMRNIKGQTATQELTGKDIIVGRNGAGKTTRMQTIGLAMLGYVPGKGKTTADTFKLASDDEMAVAMETDSFFFERSFKKKTKLQNDGSKKAEISQTLTVSPSAGETTNTQKEQRVRQELGDFPVMLDFGAFISMTDNQQRDFMYNLSGSNSDWDRDRVYEEMKKALLDPDIEENNPELYACMKECIEDTMKQYREGIDVNAGILAMSEHAKDKLKYWKKEKTNAEGAAKKLTELKNRSQETDRDLAINEQKLKEFREQKEGIIKELAEITAKNKSLEEKEAELAKIREEIARLQEAPDNSHMATLEEEIGNLEEEVAEDPAVMKQYEEKERSLQNELASLQEAERIEKDKRMALKEELATINAEIKANSDLLQRISESHGCCAFSPNIKCGQDFSGFITETQDTMDDAYEKKDDIEHKLAEVDASINTLQDKIRGTQEEQRELDDAKRTLRTTMENRKKQLEQKKTELLELNGREPVLAAKKQQEAEIGAYLDENPKVDLTSMEDQKELVTRQIEGLTSTIDEQKKIRNDLINIKSNIIDIQTAEFNKLCWERITDTIGQKGIKGKITKETLGPLMEDVNTKLHGIGIQSDFFFTTNSDTGKEIFEFGWGERPFEALSTGEQLLLMTALMTTMIEKANPPIKILAIDDINNLDSENLRRIITSMGKIASTMDNIIISGVVNITDEDAPGWKVWRL